MNDDDLYAAFEAEAEADADADADAWPDAASPADPAPEVLAEIRTRVGVRRRARFAGLAVVVTFVLIGGAVLTAGLRGTDEQSSLVVADSSTTASPADGRAEPVKVLLTGDAFGYLLGRGFEGNPLTRDLVDVSNHSLLVCGVIPMAHEDVGGGADCRTWSVEVGGEIGRFEPDIVVHALGPTDMLDGVSADGTPVPYGSDLYQALFEQELMAYATVAEGAGAHFVVLTSPPFDHPPGGVPSAFTMDGFDRVQQLNTTALELAQRHPGMTVLPFGSWLCLTKDSCRAHTASGEPMRTDGVHLTEAGAREAAAWLAPQLVQLAGGAVTTGTSVVVPTTWNGSSGDAGTLEPSHPEPTNPNDAEVADPCAQVTTIPSCTQPTPMPTVTTPITPAPTTPGAPIDCGGAYPISGWPTTMMTSSQGADCIVSAFTTGTEATYWVIDFVRNADGSSDQTTVERRDFHVTGPGRVDVVIGRRPFGNGPFDPYGELHGCTQLTKVWPDSQQVTVAGCA